MAQMSVLFSQSALSIFMPPIQTVTVTIADACPTCNNGNSIDLSLAAFKQLATLEQGLVDSMYFYPDRRSLFS